MITFLSFPTEKQFANHQHICVFSGEPRNNKCSYNLNTWIKTSDITNHIQNIVRNSCDYKHIFIRHQINPTIAEVPRKRILKTRLYTPQIKKDLRNVVRLSQLNPVNRILNVLKLDFAFIMKERSGCKLLRWKAWKVLILVTRIIWSIKSLLVW